MKRLVCLALFVLIYFIGPKDLCGQGSGAFGGAGNSVRQPSSQVGAGWNGSFVLPTDQALNFIVIDATAETRLAPEEIRVVMAITSEAKSAEDCQEQVAQRIKAVGQAWRDLGIPENKIVEDFIAVLPRYEWRLIMRDEQQVRLQQREGYRMQTNLHVSVKSEPEAMAAINIAFKQGITDIVTFDYWSSKLDEQKEKTRAEAVVAAKKKADTLLMIFDKKPPVINVQESTQVLFPGSLYRTFENVLEEQTDHWQGWNDKPMIKALRPKMTFFEGAQTEADVRPKEIAMRPEISIVSTVRIYYQSPAERSRTAGDE
jgi:uncharacterized protein YggE